MLNVNEISKLGLGEWGIGGFAELDKNADVKKQIEAMRYTLENGVNYVPINQWYAQGRTVEMIREAYKQSKIEREKLFFAQAIYDHNYGADEFDKLTQEFDDLLKYFDLDYMDCLQFNAGTLFKYGYDRPLQWLQKQIISKKLRFASMTNLSLEQLQKVSADLGDQLFSHEISFNFEVRINQDNGIIDFANEKAIKNITFQSLRYGWTARRNWPLLLEIAQKYGKTQNQIILNWISSLGFLPLVKSETKKHIDENLASFDFEIEAEDLQKLTKFRVPGFVWPEIDWNKSGKGVGVTSLSRYFEETI
jgi:diketogulonate reductase-like aldo/keto reductase